MYTIDLEAIFIVEKTALHVTTESCIELFRTYHFFGQTFIFT